MLCLVVTACENAATLKGETPPSSSSYAGTWRLTHGRGPDGDVPLVKGYRITLNIDERVRGTSACNSYGGDVAIDEESFRLKDGLEMTLIGCAPKVMDSEELYLDALAAVDTIARDQDTLILSGPDTELRFELLPPPPIAQLTDTPWQLESLIEGAGREGTAKSAAPARLILRSDGKLSGSTGCRDLEGEWIQRGDEILFTKLAAEGHCPAELQDQDGHVVEVLGDGFTAEIEAQILTLVSKGELALRYTAASNR